jgi:GNAT superfamily N-acetyltransferase
MEQKPAKKTLSLDLRDYTRELEPVIFELLRAGFGEKWGDGDYWHWKHSARPGFSASDVSIVTEANRPVACFHLTLRSMRLGPELEVACSVEGDFAVAPEARGKGIPRRGYLHVSPRLVSRSVVLRAGFSSRELYERIYKRQLGHRFMPTITAQYRKILSDRALREKIQGYGEKLRSLTWSRRLLATQPLLIRIEVTNFKPCDLVLTRESAICTESTGERADLLVRMPYMLLVAIRMPFLSAALTAARIILSGRARVSGVLRVLRRSLPGLARPA